MWQAYQVCGGVMEEWKRCSTCGNEANKDPFYVNLISCSNKKCKNYLMFFDIDAWQSRPIEDQLRSENERMRLFLDIIVDKSSEQNIIGIAKKALNEVTK